MLDRLGITATSLCALHCILLPVLLPVLSLLGLEAWASHEAEHMFLFATLVLGSVALFSGFKRYHRKIYPFYLLFLGGFIYWHKHSVDESVQPLMIIVGAVLLVAAHVVNLKLCNNCRSCSDHECGAQS
ncbi:MULTISPECIES: MerC domain-containing protein [unclassified Thalassotalea]|uniref:MerC domain-containing protein n=1 Tax=unclassified Thalassotalea TaxID=2614972 RepID=UPI0010802515|nr:MULTISPECIES: MerC domain-containing protein [unclassified Thalassotalea]NMP17176.1 MerC domain-containing protein [Thalassotalea sp. Y01]QBY03893.1 MerC domain-containing protein [Thalassotalea sp. HSM 43]